MGDALVDAAVDALADDLAQNVAAFDVCRVEDDGLQQVVAADAPHEV